MAEPNVLQPLGLRSRLPLGVQVAAGIGGLLCLIALTVAVAMLLVLGLRSDQAQLQDHSVPYASAVAAAALGAKGIANDERGYLMTSDRQFVVQLESSIPKTRVAFAAAWVAADGHAQRSAIAGARSGFERWIAVVRREIARYAAGDTEDAVAVAMGSGRAMRKSYEDSLARAQALADNALRSDQDSVASASSRSVTILLACLLAALVIGIGVALWVMRTILGPVYALLRLFGDLPQSSTPGHEAR
ncbi:MAG TPA: CHASE3 domain-containing protein [Gaiellaceae bacterium]